MQKLKHRTPQILLPKVILTVQKFIKNSERVRLVDFTIEGMASHPKANLVIILQNRNRPKNYLLNLIAQNLNQLDINDRILLISHKNWGAKSLTKVLQDLNFSSDIDTIFTGFEGFRIIQITKTHEDVNYDYQSKYKFSVKIENKFSGDFEFNFVTNDQLFSYKKLDDGTRTLVENVDFRKAKSILDLGCGWGGVGIFAHLINPEAEVTLVDSDDAAKKAALENVARTSRGGKVSVKDLAELGSKKYDLIVSYPPFHINNIGVNHLLNQLKEHTKKGTKIVFCTDQTFKSKYSLSLEAIFDKEVNVAKVGKFYLLSLTL